MTSAIDFSSSKMRAFGGVVDVAFRNQGLGGAGVVLSGRSAIVDDGSAAIKD